jgi:endonuclease/exonuclease/phosphatase family metal-dependent hydrolase
MTRHHPWIAILLLLFMVFAARSAWTTSSSGDPRPTLRVATFNIHKGAPRRGPYDLERTIDAIYRLGADVVGVQEAMRNDMAFGCDDQPALIAEGLRRRSGRPWSYVHARAWVTTNTACMDSGKGDDVTTEGLAFFSSETILESHVVRLNEGRIGLAVRLERLPQVPIVVTHLAANRQNQPDRVREIGILLPWVKGMSAGILVGDLNAEADASELSPLFANYRDAWVDATTRGTARGIANGATRPNGRSRIDYVLYDSLGDLVVESFEAVDTVALGLGEVSDHNPVVATFRRVDASLAAASGTPR